MIDKQIDRQSKRQADRQRYKKTNIDKQTNRQGYKVMTKI